MIVDISGVVANMIGRFLVFSFLTLILAAGVDSPPSFVGVDVFAIKKAQAEGFQALPSKTLRPSTTSAAYVAMLFHKMTGKPPDFEKWSRASKAYAEASNFDKVLVQTEKVEELRDVYSLLTPSEPVIVEIPLKLSQYSRKNSGFFVENFKEDTFFSFDIFGKFYTIIPSNIMNHQWLNVMPDEAERISQVASPSQISNSAVMLIYLEPKFADGKAPLSLNGKDQWLISAEVKKLAIYTKASDVLIWQSADHQAMEDLSEELLNLKQ